MLDGHDEVPFLVHWNRVGTQLVEDLVEEQRGQVEVGEANEGSECRLSDCLEKGRDGKHIGQLWAQVGEAPCGQRVAEDEDLGRRRQTIERVRQPLETVASQLGALRELNQALGNASPHPKMLQRRQLAQFGRHRGQRVSVHRQGPEGSEQANLWWQLGELVPVKLDGRRISVALMKLPLPHIKSLQRCQAADRSRKRGQTVAVKLHRFSNQRAHSRRLLTSKRFKCVNANTPAGIEVNAFWNS